MRNDNNNNNVNNSVGNKLLEEDSILMLGNNHIAAESFIGEGEKMDNKI